MFNDIINESQSVNNPEKFTESIEEILFNQNSILREASGYSLIAAFAGTESLITESGTEQRKNLIKKLIDFFRKLIARVKDFIDRKFKLTEGRLNKQIKLLKTLDYKTIEIETRGNINSVDSTVKLIKKSIDELKAYRVTSLSDTIDNMGKLEKGVELTKAILTGGKSIKNKFAGYVKSLSSHNGKEVSKIKDDILGKTKVMKGIDIDKLYPAYKMIAELKGELDAVSSSYSKSLTLMNGASFITDKANALSPNHQHFVNMAINSLTTFFNRNVNLIATLIAEVMNTILSTTTRMVFHSKHQKTKKI